MMLAARCRQAATFEVDESFTYYVDTVAGSDTTGTGTIKAPWASLSKAHTAVTAGGQSIGIKRGSVLRPGAQLSAPSHGSVRYGAYGAGDAPIVSGGKIVTGWTGVGTLGSELLTNPGFESATAPPTGWTIDSGSATQSTSDPHSGTYCFAYTGGSGRLAQTVALTGGQEYQFSFWHQEPAGSGNQGTYWLNITSGSNSGWSVSSTGAVVDTANTPVAHPTTATTWTQVTITFTMPSDGNMEIRLGAYSGAGFFDDASLKAVTTGAGPIYSATLATTTSCVKVTDAGDNVSFFASGQLAASEAAMTEGQWFQSGTTLYLYLADGSDPTDSTVEASICRPLISNYGADYTVVRKIAFELGLDGTFWQRGQYWITDRCSFAYCGYQSTPGTHANAGGGHGRLTGTTFSYVDDDGVEWGAANSQGAQNVQADHNTIIAINGVQSDGFQIADDNHVSNNAWVHHNHIDMTDTNSPKSCITIGTQVAAGGATGTGAVVEYNTCLGGHGGVSIGQDSLICRYNTMTASTTVDYAAGIYMGQDHDITSVVCHHNVISACNNGYDGPGGYTTNRRRDFTASHETIAECVLSGFYFSNNDLLSGSLTDSIIWCPDATEPVLRVGALNDTDAFDIDHCIIGPEATGFISWLGTSYDTLAAWQTATGLGANCSSSDPLFTDPDNGDFTLQAGSPAIGAASDGGNMGAL